MIANIKSAHKLGSRSVLLILLAKHGLRILSSANAPFI